MPMLKKHGNKRRVPDSTTEVIKTVKTASESVYSSEI
jgi:hypothetical protein